MGLEADQRSDPEVRVHFSPRQAQILALAAKGLPDKEVAKRLGLSVCTVRTHLHRFYKDYGVHNRVEAVVLWFGASKSNSQG